MSYFALLGQKITHSHSPLIHKAFARQFRLPCNYQLLPISTHHEFVTTIQQFQGQGVNVTAPFKKLAFAIAHSAATQAEEAQAANTLIFANGKIHAELTDGTGFMKDLAIRNLSLTAKHILILGAGATVAAMLPFIYRAQPKSVTLLNRTIAHAEQILKPWQHQQKSYAEHLSSSQLPHLPEIVINAIPSDQACYDMWSWNLSQVRFCYDVTYQALTPLLSWAKSSQVKHANGLGMLIEQAADAFSFWHHRRPDTLPIRKYFDLE